MNDKVFFFNGFTLFIKAIGVNLHRSVFNETYLALRPNSVFFKFFVIAAIVMSSHSHLEATTERNLSYKVLVAEVQKGKLDARLVLENENNFSIRLITTFEVLLLKIKSDIQLTYVNGRLKSAETSKFINGVRTEHTLVTNNYGVYKISGSEIDDLILTIPVTFSVGRLYHFEPIGYSKILSERLGREVEIRTIGKHAYELRQPDGDRNYFFYKNGVCTEMQTRMRGKAVRFVLE